MEDLEATPVWRRFRTKILQTATNVERDLLSKPLIGEHATAAAYEQGRAQGMRYIAGLPLAILDYNKNYADQLRAKIESLKEEVRNESE